MQGFFVYIVEIKEQQIVKNWIKLAISLLSLQLLGIIGGWFTSLSVRTWYIQIQKPAITPPSWVFAVVWPLLYFMMGFSFYLIWKKEKNTSGLKTAAIVFFMQMAVNLMWSILFFGFRSIIGGFIDIILLVILVVLTIIRFYRLSVTAAMLLLPYLLWLCFALVLNFLILKLN